MKSESETLLTEMLTKARFKVRGRVVDLSKYRAWYAHSRTTDGIQQMHPPNAP